MIIGALVRDKDGKPKFGNPKQIKNFKRLLKDADFEHLHEQFGDEWIDIKNRKVKK